MSQKETVPPAPKKEEIKKVEQLPTKVEKIPVKEEKLTSKVEQIPAKVEQIPAKVEKLPAFRPKSSQLYQIHLASNPIYAADSSRRKTEEKTLILYQENHFPHQHWRFIPDYNNDFIILSSNDDGAVSSISNDGKTPPLIHISPLRHESCERWQIVTIAPDNYCITSVESKLSWSIELPKEGKLNEVKIKLAKYTGNNDIWKITKIKI